MRFRGKVVLVTGAAQGIGAACIQRFRNEGARVFGFDKDFASVSSGVEQLQVDVSDERAVSEAVEAVILAAGKLDVVVNNAGIMELGTVTEITTENWKHVIDINLNGYFYVARHTLPYLVRTQGKLINVGSISGLVANRRYAAYNASKAAVHNLTRSLAIDYGPQGVRVNAVAPGSIDTTMLREQKPGDPMEGDAYWKMLGDGVPLQRIGQPPEVASAIAFLASDDASFVHGAVLTVDGGYTIQ